MSFRKFFIKINQDFAFSNLMMRGNKSYSIFFPGCSLMKYGNNFLYKVLEVIRIDDKNTEICSLCCGYPSNVLKNDYQKKINRKIIKFIEDREVDNIYVACPNCYKTLEKLKKEYNLSFSIVMLYNIINKNLSYIKEYHTLQKTIVIHDPCAIKEDFSTQESIRDILKKIGQDFNESDNNRKNTVCCGNINMNHILNKSLAEKNCKNRVLELNNKSDIIMSYCGGCLYSFGKQKAKTIHLLELIFGRKDKVSFMDRVRFTMGLNRC